MVSTTYCTTCIKTNNQLPYKKLQYPTYVKDINHDVHIRIFKVIKANGDTMEADIINAFGFTLRDNISEWGENYVQNHPNCTFEDWSKHFANDLKL